MFWYVIIVFLLLGVGMIYYTRRYGTDDIHFESIVDSIDFDKMEPQGCVQSVGLYRLQGGDGHYRIIKSKDYDSVRGHVLVDESSLRVIFQDGYTGDAQGLSLCCHFNEIDRVYIIENQRREVLLSEHKFYKRGTGIVVVYRQKNALKGIDVFCQRTEIITNLIEVLQGNQVDIDLYNYEEAKESNNMLLLHSVGVD